MIEYHRNRNYLNSCELMSFKTFEEQKDNLKYDSGILDFSVEKEKEAEVKIYSWISKMCWSELFGALSKDFYYKNKEKAIEIGMRLSMVDCYLTKKLIDDSEFAHLFKQNTKEEREKIKKVS